MSQDRKLSVPHLVAFLVAGALIVGCCAFRVNRALPDRQEAGPVTSTEVEVLEQLAEGAGLLGGESTYREAVGEQRRAVTEEPRDLTIGQELVLRDETGQEAVLRPAAPVSGPTDCDGEPGVTITVTVTSTKGAFVASPHWFNLLDTDGGDFPARLDCATPIAIGDGKSMTMDLVFPDVTAGWLVYGYEYRVTEAIWAVG